MEKKSVATIRQCSQYLVRMCSAKAAGLSSVVNSGAFHPIIQKRSNIKTKPFQKKKFDQDLRFFPSIIAKLFRFTGNKILIRPASLLPVTCSTFASTAGTERFRQDIILAYKFEGKIFIATGIWEKIN